MGIISDSINKRAEPAFRDGAVTRAERAEHHNYQEELTAFGFVSPLVLPSDRLQELKGDMTLDEFANACHIKTREAEILIENPEMEPTTQQLLTTSYAFGVSVLWLLGYHTSKENGTRHFDRELLSLISRRNAGRGPGVPHQAERPVPKPVHHEHLKAGLSAQPSNLADCGARRGDRALSALFR